MLCSLVLPVRLYLLFFDIIICLYLDKRLTRKVRSALMTIVHSFEYHLSKLINALEQEELWPDLLPNEEAFASVQPFAIDTMAFNQWLAFVFIPKCRQLLAEHKIPPPMAIAPAAEMYLTYCPSSVLSHLRILDTLTQPSTNK